MTGVLVVIGLQLVGAYVFYHLLEKLDIFNDKHKEK